MTVRQSVAVTDSSVWFPQFSHQDRTAAPTTHTHCLAGPAVSALPALSVLQPVHPWCLSLSVETAGLVVVGTLRAAYAGDDGG